MTLQDLENWVLLALQQPGSNPGGSPTWTASEFPQNQVDFAINRAYSRLVSDLSSLELLTNQLTFPTTAQQYSYRIQTNSAKTAIGTYASGTVTFTGTVAAGQTPSVTINATPFTYTTTATDTLATITQAFITKVNASTLVLPGGTILQPVTPTLNTALNVLTLYAGITGPTSYSLAASGSGSLVATASGSTLTGGLATNQPIQLVRRVRYQPLGQLYRLELEPGARLVSWEQFNRETGAGYMLSYSYATNPDFCAISPTRQFLYLYPGPFTVGDQIIIDYCPTITSNAAIPATNWGYLVSSTDIPLMPEDTQDAIWMGAVGMLMPKAREIATGKLYGSMYKEEVQRIKDNYERDSAGDALVLKPAEEVLATSGWDGWIY